MEIGLDELIESLLTEIAFSGVRGCSVATLLKTIDSFYNDAQEQVGTPAQHRDERQTPSNANNSLPPFSDALQTRQDPSSHDFCMYSKVWGWLVSRADVSVGTNRQFNHCKLEEILALPEEEDDLIPADDASTSKNQNATPANERQRPSKGHRGLQETTLKYRPRLHVSDERQWKTIAGHGPDLKRLPLFEWKALVDIASVREKGILQGDLVRLSGQDKRSLPTRTDALAKKGYIIKQPIILRGCRSSKLWLARFADNAKENRDGLNLEKLDLSKETLTKDLRPVPFSASWNGERLDYIAIAQAFNAVIKAWGIMRYCDVRTKLDANRVPQMRALAKTSRWFTSIGAVTFVAARFANGQRLFKDCVKFIREPTAEEWRVFRTTPSAHIKVPSARLGKRGQASRARFNKGAKFSPHSQAKPKQASSQDNQTKSSNKEQLVPSLWTPYKPMVNTTFEIIKRAGPKGSSNLEIGRQTLGHSYRKYIAALTGTLSLPNSQPPHLQHLDVTSQLNRIGKTMTYQFFANGELSSSAEQGDENNADCQNMNSSVRNFDGQTSQHKGAIPRSLHIYSQVQSSKLTASPVPFSQLHDTLLAPGPKKSRKRKRGPEEPTKDASGNVADYPNKIPRIDTAPSRDVAADTLDAEGEEIMDDDHGTYIGGNVPIPSPTTTLQQPILEPRPPASPEKLSAPPPPSRPPGVYREPDNSLDPPGKKGRRKKSLVLTLKLNPLKSWLERAPDKKSANTSEVSTYQPSTRSLSPAQGPPQATLENGSTLSEAGPSQVKQKSIKRGSKTVFQCDKCGNSWKNSNGLDYHLNKSRTACNPAYVPAPAPAPRQLAKPKAIPKTVSPNTIDSQEQDHDSNTLRLPGLSPKSLQRNSDVGSGRPLLPAKRIRPSENFTSSQDTTQKYTGSSIILQDVEAYSIIDNRKRKENSQAALTNLVGTIPPPSQANQTLFHMTTKKLGDDAPNTVQNQEVTRERESKNEPEGSQKRKSKPVLPRKHDRKIGAENPECYTTAYQPHSEQMHIGDETPAPPDFDLRINLLKPVVPIARPPSRTAVPPVALGYPINHNGSNNSQDLPTTIGSRLDNDATQANQSALKKPRKSSTLTVGTIRKDRTTSIIQHLLDRNDGVFPGQRSLYLAIVSLWVKRYSDIEPPDWKVCQNLVNKMERAGVLAQHRFFFLDDNGKLQECCVLTKGRQSTPTTTDLAADPKVDMIKEKMREMHPEPYIPEEFSLAQDESELFDALASKYRDSTPSNGPRKQLRKSNVTEDIEVLQYPAYVVNDASTHTASSKRPAEEDELLDMAPAKKIRVDAGTIDKARKAPKPRKRGEQRESWATTKVAKYIWNQKQNPGEKWNQKHAYLQDFATGTWSTLPQEATSMRPSIDRILSSLRTSRENALISMGRLSSSRSNSAESPKANSTLSSRQLLWNHDSAGFGNGEGCDEPTPEAAERAEQGIVDRFVKPSVSTSFIPEDSGSEEEDDDTMLTEAQHGDMADESSNPLPQEPGTIFVKSKLIKNTRTGCWPWLSVSFFESNSTSFALDGAMPEARWFQRANLPQNSGDILKSIRGKFQFNSWADPSYGKFLREVGIIERWEQSPEGSQILLHGSVAPDYIFISLSSDESKANMKPITLEWPSNGQYTEKNLPDEIKNASFDDENAGLSINHRNRGRPRREHPIDSQPNEQAKPSVKKPVKKIQVTPAPQAEVQYKTRSLRPIPIQHRGRVSIPRPNEENLGLSGETEVIAAFVVFKTLLGGVDRKADIGSILKAFPKFSHSALRKFWPRVSRERKTYIDALTEKFQSEFLKAYEAGEVEPLNYDDIDSYDWQSLIIWATKLETHDKVELPGSRRDLEDTFSLEDVGNEATDWRETWFQNLASIYSRVEATASEPISIPLNHDAPAEGEVLSRARSWVRSLCVTPIRGAKTPEEIRTRLLSLSGGNEAETNKLLKKVVDKLISERVASRSKGKILGQSLRLHGVFAKHLDKPATVEKFAQSANFKTLLDESFRQGREFIVPYVADEGTIMAIFNLQAQGRIRTEAVDIPNIPFGFEPGNYDGRTFPKSYYHFNVRLLPTESYVYNEGLPVLQQAGHVGVPKQGPQNEIPIWVDFFGNLDKARWITYLSMTTLALATKGPLTPQTASVLLKPFVEPFEAKLIMDWIDGLGILKRYELGQSATVGEWWWLVVGQLALDVVGRGVS